MKDIRVDPRTYMVPLGRRAENQARRIRFEASDFLAEGAGVFTLLHQRPGDEKPYPVTPDVEGDEVIWMVTSTDTASAGNGMCELQYKRIEDDTLIKSRSWRTHIEKSIADPEDAGDFGANWYARLVDKIIEELASLGIETTYYAYSMEDNVVYVNTIIDMDYPTFEIDLTTGILYVSYPDNWTGTTFEIEDGILIAKDGD